LEQVMVAARLEVLAIAGMRILSRTSPGTTVSRARRSLGLSRNPLKRPASGSSLVYQTPEWLDPS
jgi:hypothetical protein